MQGLEASTLRPQCPLWVKSRHVQRKSDVRFTPNSDRESGLPHKVISALPPKADMCSALAHVCFGPKADIPLFIRSPCRRGQAASAAR
jgi:hypothetical protein